MSEECENVADQMVLTLSCFALLVADVAAVMIWMYINELTRKQCEIELNLIHSNMVFE